ncbi:MAG TPA: prenyltransferase/squalene oxidase repeat-containing protein [Candidatus Bathyarchaeia archaeon]|nr:prenyltransferase/squalene oxidase repeat-containing protein [Candidatus Bathyarchaeia archaeon]
MRLKELSEGAYVFLLVDQHENGLWGKSISINDEKPYASEAENRYLEKTKTVQSITLGYQASEAIIKYTLNRENSAVKKCLTCIKQHEDKKGGFGAYGEIISAYHGTKTCILSNSRHTATALLTFMVSMEKSEFERIAKAMSNSIEFIIDSKESDGGWGLPKEESDSASTLYVMQLLTSIKDLDVSKILSKEYSEKLDQAIISGMKWLKTRNQENGGNWFSIDIDGISSYIDTAEVLTFFSNIKKYDTTLYDENLDRLSKLQNILDGGWPHFPNAKNKSDLRATIWIANALSRSNHEKYKTCISKGFEFILQNIPDPAYSTTLSSGDWALLLDLCTYQGIHVSTHREYELSILAEEIRSKVFEKGNLRYLEKDLPTEFVYLRSPIRKALKNSNPEIANKNIIEIWLDNTPRWVKWLIASTITIASLILAIKAALNLHF